MGETTPVPRLLQLAGVHPTEHHQTVIMSPSGPVFVDVGIVDLLRALWRYGLRTRFSCQGGRYPDLGRPGKAGYVDFTTTSAHGRLKTLLGPELTAALEWNKNHPRRGHTAVWFQPEQIPEIVAALSKPAPPTRPPQKGVLPVADNLTYSTGKINPADPATRRRAIATVHRFALDPDDAHELLAALGLTEGDDEP